ncbi:MAG: 4Fe-4S dicluster domain-containing protein [Calditrichaeota bacterium]|nr:MAG: 4Fe-4S dicluster domain-containing protein [Calditrichota bacterium]
MDVSRRKFLNVSLISSAALLHKSVGATPTETVETNEDSLGVLVDTSVCIGCRKCEWACNQQHKLTNKSIKEFEDKRVFKEHRRPDDNAYTVVNEYAVPERKKPFQMKVQCMHCNDPACVSACIVGALEKDPMGPVTYDAWECIGCRYCIVVCPFQIPAYEYDNALTPQVRKCTFCIEKGTKEGKLPACVDLCPNEALTFGPRKELLDLAHGRIKESPDRYVDHVYGKYEAGGTSWLYLSPVEFTKTELPKLSNDPIPQRSESIQHNLFKWFVPPIALYGLLGLVMHQTDKKAEEGVADE